MFSRDDLFNKLLSIAPNSKFSFWPNDGREREWVDDKVDYVVIDEWCVAWLKSNARSCPTLEELQAVTDQQANDDAESRRKDGRDAIFSKDLSIVAAFGVAQQANPDLDFTSYMDSLEQKAASLQSKVAQDQVAKGIPQIEPAQPAIE